MENQLRFTRDELLTPDDVAEILRVQRTTALEYMRRGVIPARKIGKLWLRRTRITGHSVEQIDHRT